MGSAPFARHRVGGVAASRTRRNSRLDLLVAKSRRRGRASEGLPAEAAAYAKSGSITGTPDTRLPIADARPSASDPKQADCDGVRDELPRRPVDVSTHQKGGITRESLGIVLTRTQEDS